MALSKDQHPPRIGDHTPTAIVRVIDKAGNAKLVLRIEGDVQYEAPFILEPFKVSAVPKPPSALPSPLPPAPDADEGEQGGNG